MKRSGETLQRFVRLAILVAVMLLFALTPVGYIKVGAIEITLMVLPVAIGAITLGPLAGTLLGAVFGITSFLQCLGIPSVSAFGSAVFAINPYFTAVMCIIPRVLVGLLTGLLFKATMKNQKPSIWKFALSSLCAPLSNTILFVGSFLILFSNTDFFRDLLANLGQGYLLPFIAAFVGINGLVEIGVAMLVALPITRVLYAYQVKTRTVA